MSSKSPQGSRFLVIEQIEMGCKSLPPGTRLVAKGQTLEELLEPLEAKSGLRLDGGGRDGTP